jgi:hypothetical protein
MNAWMASVPASEMRTAVSAEVRRKRVRRKRAQKFQQIRGASVAAPKLSDLLADHRDRPQAWWPVRSVDREVIADQEALVPRHGPARSPR